jgi:hypothetical protein
MAAETAVDQLETAIQGGGVDIQVEVVESGSARFAQVAVTVDDADDLDLSLRDVIAIRDLANRTIVAMETTREQGNE